MQREHVINHKTALTFDKSRFRLRGKAAEQLEIEAVVVIESACLKLGKSPLTDKIRFHLVQGATKYKGGLETSQMALAPAPEVGQFQRLSTTSSKIYYVWGPEPPKETRKTQRSLPCNLN